ncbi:MAG: hypothetical protein ACOVNL_13790 [Prochlorococcaceae cyanobacterium]|jgi:hypothetical protein
MPAFLHPRACFAALAACLALAAAPAGAFTPGSTAPALPAGGTLLAQGLGELYSESIFSGIRAVNLARNVAVKLNGGLGVYRPADCMFRSSSDGNTCLISRSAEGFLFRFLGGPPGWQQLGLPPTIETEILISPNGRAVVNLVYNGALRAPAPQAPAPGQP